MWCKEAVRIARGLFTIWARKWGFAHCLRIVLGRLRPSQAANAKPHGRDDGLAPPPCRADSQVERHREDALRATPTSEKTAPPAALPNAERPGN